MKSRVVHLVALLAVAFSAAPSFAKKQSVDTAKASQFFSLISLGVDFRAERSPEQSAIPRSWPSFSIGAGVRPWMASLEYASFNEGSGNGAVSVERKAETLILWGQWFTDDPWPVQPYVGLGLGVYRNSAQLTLYEQQNRAEGKWIEHASGSIGLQLSDVAPFWFAIEGRVHINRELDPNPTVGGMFRVGFILE